MENTEKLLAAFLTFLIIMLIFAYGLKIMDNMGKFEPKPDTKASELMQLANPASVYCEQQNGKLEIRESPEGQIGYCIFPNGKECEEWAFFRKECS